MIYNTMTMRSKRLGMLRSVKGARFCYLLTNSPVSVSDEPKRQG